jgi:PAS domain S-box-containing protein
MEEDQLKRLYKRIETLEKENATLKDIIKEKREYKETEFTGTRPDSRYETILNDPKKQGNASGKIENNQLRQKIIENLTELVSITDTKGKFTYVSPSHYNVLSYSPEELEGKSIFDFLHPNDTGKIYSLFKEKIKEQSTGKTEYRYQTKNGNYIWLETFGKTIINEKGEPQGAIFTTREITEQKIAHEKLTFLSESGTKFLQIPSEEEIYQYIGRKIKKKFRKDLVVVNSYDHDKQSLTPEFIRGYGKQRSDIKHLTGKPVTEMHYHISSTDNKLRNGKLNYLSIKSYNYNFKDLSSTTLKQFAEKYDYEYLYYIGLSMEGTIYGSIVILSQNRKAKAFKSTLELFARQASFAIYRKKVEKQFLEAKKKAEETDRLKSAFLANMSHEIRTPMNGIIGFSQLLQARSQPPEKEQLFLSQIIENSRQLLTLLNDIIDISKIEAGQLTIEKQEINLNFLIDETANLFDKEKGNKIKLISHKGLKTKESYIITDPDRLKQVINNLLSNAIKFTKQGTVEFGYELEKNRKLKFFVKDTGIGISKEQQQIIFDRFKQAEDGTTRKFSGTGLGLAISKELIEMMGGKIGVKSELKKGAEFTFTLPYEKGTYAVTEDSERNETPDYKWPGKKILIVEDNDTNYLFLQTCLEETNCQIERESDGKTAIQKGLNDKSIDLILMDIQLPSIDGLTATKEIKLFRKDLPIIAQTAYAMHGDKQKALDAGCSDYIAKPIDPKMLLEIIASYME